MKNMTSFARLVALAIVGVAGAAQAQAWVPTKNVELVVPNPPGGSNDKTARTIERILLASKALPSATTGTVQGAAPGVVPAASRFRRPRAVGLVA